MHPDTSREWGPGLAALQRGWRLIALLALCVAVIAAIVSLQVPGEQRATGRLIVAPSTNAEAAFSPDTVRVLTQPGVIGTLTEIVENPGTFEAAGSELGVEGDALADYTPAAQEIAGSMVVEVHVDGPNAEVAQALATQLVDDASQRFDELYPVYRVHVLDEVRPLDEALTPSPIQYAVLGALIGAAGGALLLLAWGRLRRGSAPVPPPPAPPVPAPSRSARRTVAEQETDEIDSSSLTPSERP